MPTIKIYGRPSRSLNRPPFIPPDVYVAVTFQGDPVTFQGVICTWTGTPPTQGS